MNKTFLSTLWSLTLVVTAAALSGCSTTINSAERAQPFAEKQMVDDHRVLTDASLNRKVRIVGVNEALTPAGLIKINVEVQNLRRSAQPFNYRVEWFDLNGMPVEIAGNAWVHREILGKETLNFTAVAPNSQASDFRIKLIENPR